MRALIRLFSSFRHDRSGNIAVIFALALVPLISAIGCAVDYSQATRMRAKLQSAADGAAVAAISQKSPGFVAASAMTGNGSVTAGVTDANNIFDGNMNQVVGLNNLSRTSTVTKAGVKLTSNVSFSADVPVTFMKVAGFQKLTVTGSSSASASLPPYLDFYLMLDLSGSMGLPSTDAEQTRLSQVNPDDFTVYTGGCTFACHFQASGSCSDPAQGQKANAAGVTSPINSAYPTNNYCMGYLISRVGPAAWNGLLQANSKYPMKGVSLPSTVLANANSNVTPGAPNSLLTGNVNSVAGKSLTAVTSCPTEGAANCIQLRADAVGFALNATKAANGVSGLFETAKNRQIVTNQYRIGLYPFIRYLWTYFGLTNSITGDPNNSSTINYAAANLATLLDTGSGANLANLGSGGTHFENAFPGMNTLIKTVGTGTSPTDTQPFVFLVTDGAQNFQTCCGFSGSNSATVMPTGASSYCKPLKDRGIIISVLYIPYQKIQNPTTIFNNEDNVANANIQNIKGSLTDCASPNFYFEANAPADITTALNQMFTQALMTAHITN